MATLTANLFLNTSGFTSGIEKARAATSNYHQEMTRAARSIQGLEGNIRVLEMQASGYDDLAASLRRTLDIEAQADKLAKSGLITREKALALLEKERLLQTNIATQKSNKAAAEAAAAQKAARMANPRAVGLPEVALTPEILKQTERAGALAQEASRKFNLLTRGVGGTSMGFLAFSQAVEDAQYGIKGVLNNIPQMILGFGGSMGLAGAISLAAVAAVQLYPHLKRLFSSVDAQILKNASAEWTKIFDKGMKAAKATYENAVNSIKLKNEIAQIAQYYRQITALGQDMGEVHRANIERLKTERDLQEQIYEARDRLLKLKGIKDDPTIEREKAEREIASLEKEMEMRRKEQDANNARSKEAQEARVPLVSMGSDEEALRKADELRALEEELAKVKADAGAAEKALEEMKEAGVKALKIKGDSITSAMVGGMGGSMPAYTPATNQNETSTTKSNEERKLKESKILAEEIQKQIDNAKKLLQADEDERKSNIQKIDDEIKKIDELNQKSFDEEKRLKALIAQKKELLALNNQINPLENKNKQDEYNKSYDEEMAVLKARANGDEKELQRLEYKKRLQAEINELKKAGFVDEGKGDLLNKAKKRVDARINADDAEENRKNNPPASSGGVSQLGSVARATNILMGRAANDGILEENRRQTSLLRNIDKNTTKPTKETTKLPLDFVFS